MIEHVEIWTFSPKRCSTTDKELREWILCSAPFKWLIFQHKKEPDKVINLHNECFVAPKRAKIYIFSPFTLSHEKWCWYLEKIVIIWSFLYIFVPLLNKCAYFLSISSHLSCSPNNFFRKKQTHKKSIWCSLILIDHLGIFRSSSCSSWHFYSLLSRLFLKLDFTR